MKLFGLLGLVLAAFLFIGCTVSPLTPQTREFASPRDSQLQAKYHVLWDHVSQEAFAELQRKLPDSISLERTSCWGHCPAYRVTFHRDGSAELIAISDIPLKGKYTAKIDPDTYARLCCLLEQLHFADFKPKYTDRATDSASCIITVNFNNKTQSVDDYNAYGPIELWAIEQIIDHVTEGLSWEPDTPDQPHPQHQNIFRNPPPPNGSL